MEIKKRKKTLKKTNIKNNSKFECFFYVCDNVEGKFDIDE